MTTLGIHANTNNQHALLLRYCREVKPSAVKLLDPNREVVNDIRAASPGTIIIGRQYWSDQRLDNYGEFRAAAVDMARRSGVDYAEGLNEWGLTRANASSFAGAELSLARELNRHGIGAAIGGFSTGYLDSNLDGDRSWTHFREAFDYMETAGKLANGRPKCVLHFHEYSHYLQYGVHIPGSVLGPDQWNHAGHHWTGFAPSREYYEDPRLEGWWTLRYRKLWKVLKAKGYHNIHGLITEFGCDDVNPRPCGHGRGWRDFTGCEHFNDPRVGDFVDQCAWYMRQVSRDPYILGVVDFGFATADPAWLSFDFSQTPREFDKLIATQRALAAPAPAPAPPPPAPTPAPIPPTPVPAPTPALRPRVTAAVGVYAVPAPGEGAAAFAGRAAGRSEATYGQRMTWAREIATANGLPTPGFGAGVAYRLPSAWFAVKETG